MLSTHPYAGQLALLRAPGIGPARYALLVEHFGSAAGVFSGDPAEWGCLKLPEATRAYLKKPDWQKIEQDLRWLEQPDNYLIDRDDDRYPPLLRQIAASPPLLFVHGEPECLQRPQIAIVGTRNPTPSGREIAHHFAAYLAEAGLVITSGLALGIDASAHQGALSSGGYTLAVMGTGLDRVYPAQHRDLAHAIAKGGALVSEFPAGTVPAAQNFPRRNRLISGLALGVLVVEAAARSGSLITARYALEQNREVFAIPGSIYSPLAKGCHALIRDGAKLVETAADVLEELGSLVAVGADECTMPPAPSSEAPKIESLDNEYQQLLSVMGNDPAGVDLLVERCGLTAEEVSSMLLMLELKGFVAAVPGGMYCRPRL
ncbi:MAG: DNA-protecting protein DprA [Candidatus Contendobacter odensis]|uniref:DNA-protecting protein DprA n=1 Tax=Candidatus Contendibacter odensensis TaxID=1400860 RepID=A0A2G6PFI6_9GAMM|nr:MAG: DNA-protecting protein DprA [Candidatus Contendobacter odensis]